MTALYADPRTLWARTLRRVVRTPDGCWQWTGSVNSKGYGLIASGAAHRNYLVHRLALVARGVNLDGLTSDHLCHRARPVRGWTGLPPPPLRQPRTPRPSHQHRQRRSRRA